MTRISDAEIKELLENDWTGVVVTTHPAPTMVLHVRPILEELLVLREIANGAMYYLNDDAYGMPDRLKVSYAKWESL